MIQPVAQAPSRHAAHAPYKPVAQAPYKDAAHAPGLIGCMRLYPSKSKPW
jgi:hypothetical protein